MNLWPLVGRADELSQLRLLLERDDCGGAVLAGAAGVGKTRLALESLALAERAGFVAVRAVATRTAAELPLGALAHLLPASTDGASSSGFSDQADFLRRAAAGLLGRVGDRRLFLLVDDAQLLDHLSAMLLYHLVTNRSAFVLMTVRNGEAVPELVTALWKEGLVERIDVEGLSDTAARALVQEALGGQMDPIGLTAIVSRCQGNVLYLHEMVQGALSDGTLEQDDNSMWRLTRPLHPSRRLIDMIEARLGTLSPAATAVLEYVAFGEPLGWAELELLADPDTARELEREQIIVSRFNGRRLEVRLVHPMYGDVIRARTGAIRVRDVMRALAEVIELFGARRREDILRVGTWRLVCGGGKPELMLAAARTARQRYDFALAERLVAAALEVGAGFEARLLAAQLKYLQGFNIEAEAGLVELNQAASCDDERGQIAISRLDNFLYAVRPDDSLRVAEEAEMAISSPEWRDEIAARRSFLLITTRGPRAAVEVGEPIVARASGSTRVMASLPVSYGMFLLGRVGDALELSETGHREHLALPQPIDWYPWFHLWIRCETLSQSGRVHDGQRLAREQHAQAIQDGSTDSQALFAIQLAKQVADRGHVRTAMRLAQEAAALFRSLGRTIWLRDSLQCLALAASLAGELDTARRELAALDSLPDPAGMYSVIELDQTRAWFAASRNDLPAARRLFRAAAKRGEEIGDLIGAVGSLHSLARIGGGARTVLPDLERLVRDVQGDLPAARLAHVAALAHRDAEGLQAAAAEFEAMGVDLLAAEASTDAAVAWRTQGYPKKAAAAARIASSLTRNCEEPRTPALQSLSTRVALTPAERETALLAAAGQANKEIAAKLFLSVRSVENRLQHVYEKLGIDGRSELADVLHDQLPT